MRSKLRSKYENHFSFACLKIVRYVVMVGVIKTRHCQMLERLFYIRIKVVTRNFSSFVYLDKGRFLLDKYCNINFEGVHNEKIIKK